MEYLRADLHTNYITPVADVFQVNHFDVPRTRPEGWSIKIGGLAKWQLDLTMADLEDMPHSEVTAFHECAGSPIYPDIPQRRIANIKWTGVPLAPILREIGIDERARYVLSRGVDGGTWQSMRHPSYEKDLPLAKALDPAVLLAVAMNDTPLSVGHGGPVRLVVPGYYGTNSTKWLRQILLSAGRSRSAFTTTYYTDREVIGGTTRETPVWDVAPNSIIVSKVTAKEIWATDVRLPGMSHGRVVHPKTLGSTLISAGQLDKKQFPNSQVVVKGNLVGVVAPTEWEAIQASQQLAATTKWSDWKGLPGSAKLHDYLRKESDWTSAPVQKSHESKGDVSPALASAHKKLSATYQFSYMKHAPIGPTMALADVQSDGTVHIHTHNQNPQALRGEIATMLGTTPDHVIVHTHPGAGHYGRSNGGNAGAEDEAVILSQAVGKPVRVQWMRAEDLQWSTQSSAAIADVEIALDENGKISAYQVDHYMPAMQDDRPIGAVLAGLPTMPAPEVVSKSVTSTVNGLSDPWLYQQIPNVAELGHGTFQVGQKTSPLAVGLRDHSMRTPGQFQQNYPRELAISEAAALAGVDALQFRLDHAKEERAIAVLKAVRDASGWDARPSPRPDAKSTGASPVRGRGVSLMFRSGTYWACVCQIAVTPSTGAIVVEKYAIAVDPGIVVNPAQLKRQVEGGAVMGISHALYEEAMFDESGITSRDWNTYPIAKMTDTPEIKVVLINNPKVGAYGGGSEAANALAAPAIAAALHDATGKVLRRLPLKRAYVQAFLKA